MMFGIGRARSTGYLTLANLTITSSENSGLNADANYIIEVDGGVSKYQETAGSGGVSGAGEWFSENPYAPSGVYEVRLTHSTGINRRTDALGTGWITINADKTFTFDWNPGAGPQGPDVSTYTVEIGIAGSSTALISATLTISLEILSP